jgi:hypothetical protein
MSPPFPLPVGFLGPAPGGGAPSGIVTTGLTVHLDAGDAASYPGSGTTWADLTANNHDFTFGSGATPSHTSSPGFFRFFAANERAMCPDVFTITTGACEMWVRWGPMGAPSTPDPIILAGRSDPGRSWFALGAAAAGVSLEYNAGFITHQVMSYSGSSSTELFDGVWHQIVAVMDGVSNQLYIDGAAVTTTARFGSLSGTSGKLWQNLSGNNSSIGAEPNGGFPAISSEISIFRLYDAAAFSAADVLQNWNAQRARFGR